MAIVEMVMPKMGESVIEGTILNWLKEIGDVIEQDESVLEVATDKVDTEVPAIYGGILKEILAKKGEVIQVGNPIARIETNKLTNDGDDLVLLPEREIATVNDKAVVVQTKVTEARAANNGFFSPLILLIAKEENISLADLATIAGSGKDKRLTKKNLLAYLAQRKSDRPATPASVQKIPLVPEAKTQTKVAPTTAAIDDEIIEMDRVRKMIAERMLASRRLSAHVTSFVEVDLTRVVRWRTAQKHIFKEKYSHTLTFTPIFVMAVTQALQDFPMMNISVDGSKIIKKKRINIGIAVALPIGNLIVPVVHDANHLNLVGLALKISDLVKRARENKLKPDELSGGTYTLSNVGTFGNVLGTPIIMQPQVGIMAFGAIAKKPTVIETPEGDLIGIRSKMFLSHSYDHRVVDGALGGMFVRRVADHLEAFDIKQCL